MRIRYSRIGGRTPSKVIRIPYKLLQRHDFVLMRYFEARGEVRQAISVMKKRGSRHERTIREFGFVDGRIHVGAALRDFRGILNGVPVFESDGKADRRTSDDR